MNLLILILSLLTVCSANAEVEYAEHGTPNKHTHNSDVDHQAILGLFIFITYINSLLGSRKTAHEFDDLSPEESKKRLKVLAIKMDLNKDGYVDKHELTEWIYQSLLKLDEEETRERYEEIDAGN
jgi:hypothetical protein